MRTNFFIAAATSVIFLTSTPCFAADTNTAKFQLGELIGKVQAKVNAGKRAEKDFADEVKEFDALYAKHKAEKTADAAQILLSKVNLYLQVFNEPEKAIEPLKEVQRSFPDLKLSGNIEDTIKNIERAAEGKKVQSSLVEGAKFPDFDEKDMAGKPLSAARFKGKVVLVDFWATWCPPCRAELPNVIKTYEKHHSKGFEIIGISLDKDKKTLEGFIKDRDMTWPQYFDGLAWGNKLAGKYAVQSIPMTFLLDREGKIIAKNLRGEDLESAVEKALAKK